MPPLLRAQDHAAHTAARAMGLARRGQPFSTPVHGLHTTAGEWSIMLHGRANLVWTEARGPRGDEELFSTNHVMATAARPLAGGTFELRGMATVEPAMGARGYPLLLQTGESADGLFPLVDRQHPHDAIMELSATWQRTLPQDIALFGYLALVGEPAVGPPAYMHRTSGRAIPVAPLAHHYLDATHITYGVATLGLMSRQRLLLEASAFNGLEPDQHRWGIEQPSYDSFAFRATAFAGQNFALQAGIADLASPERMHPGVDQVRLTASAIWNRPLPDGNWQTTIAYGRNKSVRTLIPVIDARRTFPAPVLDHYISLADSSGIPADSLILLFPTRVQSALLVESTLQTGRSTVFARFERAQKAELFAPADVRHSEIWTVNKLGIGYTFDVRAADRGRAGVGLAISVHLLPAGLRDAYGRRPTSIVAFTRVDL